MNVMKPINPFTAKTNVPAPTRIRTIIMVALSCQAVVLAILLFLGSKSAAQPASDEFNASVQTLSPLTAIEQPVPTALPSASSNEAAGVSINVPSTPVVAAANAPMNYTVRSGDTYSKIALAYHIPVRALLEANPGVAPTQLQAGKVLSLPVAATLANAARLHQKTVPIASPKLELASAGSPS